MYFIAVWKWITSIFILTCAYWTMINNFTICVLSAYTGARWYTFQVFTCLIRWAFCTNDTFRSAIRRWTSIIWHTWTYTLSIWNSTLAVWSTWWWLTRIWWNIFLIYNKMWLYVYVFMYKTIFIYAHMQSFLYILQDM